MQQEPDVASQARLPRAAADAESELLALAKGPEGDSPGLGMPFQGTEREAALVEMDHAHLAPPSRRDRDLHLVAEARGRAASPHPAEGRRLGRGELGEAGRGLRRALPRASSPRHGSRPGSRVGAGDPTPSEANWIFGGSWTACSLDMTLGLYTGLGGPIHSGRKELRRAMRDRVRSFFHVGVSVPESCRLIPGPTPADRPPAPLRPALERTCAGSRPRTRYSVTSDTAARHWQSGSGLGWRGRGRPARGSRAVRRDRERRGFFQSPDWKYSGGKSQDSR